MKSVLQDWVMELPLKFQSTLLTALRGPDGLEKNNSAKMLCRVLRSAVLLDADEKSSFLYLGNYDAIICYANEVVINHDHYSHHFLMHLIHAYEILAYKCPDKIVRKESERFYREMCEAMHMHPETEEELNYRLR